MVQKMRRLDIDETQHERTPHGTFEFPFEVHHDDLSQFVGRQVPSHWHGELEISLLQKGRALYTLGGGCYPLCAGEGILINANVPHMVTPIESDNVEMLTVIVHPSLLGGAPGGRIETEFLRPFLGAKSLAAIQLTDEECAFFQKIGMLDADRPFAYELKIKGLLCEVFYELLVRHQEALCNAQTASMEDLRRMTLLLETLHAHYDEPLSLDRLAKTLALSKESCCRFFKRMTGQTITQYLEDYRVAQSLPLLLENTYSIAQIGAIVGFSSGGRFSKAFFKRMACTPGQYLRAHRSPL